MSDPLLDDGPELWSHCAGLVAKFDGDLDPVGLTWLCGDVDLATARRYVRPRWWLGKVNFASLQHRSVMRREHDAIGTTIALTSAQWGPITLVLDGWSNWGRDNVDPSWTSGGGRVVNLDIRRTRPTPSVTLHLFEAGERVVDVEVGLGTPPPTLEKALDGLPWALGGFDSESDEQWNHRRSTGLAVVARLTGIVPTSTTFTGRQSQVRLRETPYYFGPDPLAGVPIDPAVTRICADTTYAEPIVQEATAILADIGIRSAGLDDHPLARAAVARLAEIPTSGLRPEDAEWKQRIADEFRGDLATHQRFSGRPDLERPADWFDICRRATAAQGLSNAFDENAYHALVGGWWSVDAPRVIIPTTTEVTSDEAAHHLLGAWLYEVRDSGRYPV